METWDAIRSRRNVRTYADRPIAAEDLDRVLEAARRSPSSKNGQPWDLVVVTDRDRLRRLSGVWRSGGHIAGAAAAVALVSPASDDPATRDWHAFDLGQAAMSLMLSAADLGIGSCHSAIGDQDLAREVLGVPGDHEVFSILSFGYPADRPIAVIGTPDRRSFDDVVHRGGWDDAG
jgi:nitroreductase